MTQLSYLDHLAVEGKTWLHRINPRVKILAMTCVLAIVVTVRTPLGLLFLYVALVVLFFGARIPLRIFGLTFYPLIFAVLLVSVSGFHLRFILLLFLKVLCGSTGIVLLLATTPYPSIFSLLGKFLPSLLVTTLFLTYRSVFILLNLLEETQQALYLRGGIQWRHPWRSLTNLSNAFGHLVIQGMDASEKMYQAMLLRGFSHKIHYRGE